MRDSVSFCITDLILATFCHFSRLIPCLIVNLQHFDSRLTAISVKIGIVVYFDVFA